MNRVTLDDFNAIPDVPSSERYGRLSIVPATEVEEEDIEFLDPEQMIPLRGITVVQGDPKIGKSTWTFWQAARITKEGGHVLISSLEDPWAPIIKPRLRVAGADMERVAFVKCDDHPGFSISKDPTDVQHLEEIVADNQTKLLIVDPFMGHLSQHVDPYKDTDVRKSVQPLAQMADRQNMAVVVVNHVTKDTSRSVMYRGSGSLGGIQGIIRSGLMFEVTRGCEASSPYRTIVHYAGNWSALRPSLDLELGEVDGVSFILPRLQGHAILPERSTTERDEAQDFDRHTGHDGGAERARQGHTEDDSSLYAAYGRNEWY